MLNRFRKNGGFQQLLTLIETCDPIKQQNLLQLVCKEDPGWAHLVKAKTISVDRILTWPEAILREVASQIPEKILIPLFFSLRSEQRALLSENFNFIQKKFVEDNLGLSIPTIAEQNAARIKLIQIVRRLEETGIFKFQTFDPTLVIDPSVAA